MRYRLVWFKRDLRVVDHAPLCDAAACGPVLCIYVVEPSLWQQADAATQHYRFIVESLHDLNASLQAQGGALWVVVGEMVEVLQRLHAVAPFEALHSHEETGNAHTYARDRAVAAWCRAHGVSWHETPSFGVVRRLRHRREWQRQWEQRMSAPVLGVPRLQFEPPPWPSDTLPPAHALGLSHWDPPLRQRGGRLHAQQTLHEFVESRCVHYRGGISSPLTAPDACSRLSAYLAYGCLSLREVVHTTRHMLAALPPEATRQRQGLTAFHSRLYWHCHFIQKLESEPELEWRNLHRGYDGLREPEWQEDHFQALQAGATGWPMVDACVAMLRQTGWLNFRMRAMLVSVAAYPLWLHWRRVGEWLAREFLDYEPGIHWSQMQMQSGTTGINATRVYNPIKQAIDHDPNGVFVRRWLPALRAVPDSWVFEPWRMPHAVRAHADVQWPMPVVELEAAMRQAKARLHQRRALPDVQAINPRVLDKHGSRRGMPGASRDASGQERPVRRRRLAADSSQQLTLDW